jgi:hypothetical protein
VLIFSDIYHFFMVQTLNSLLSFRLVLNCGPSDFYLLSSEEYRYEPQLPSLLFSTFDILFCIFLYFSLFGIVIFWIFIVIMSDLYTILPILQHPEFVCIITITSKFHTFLNFLYSLISLSVWITSISIFIEQKQ